MVVNSSNLIVLNTTLRKMWGDAFAGTPTRWQRFAESVPVTKSSETLWLSVVPTNMRKYDGEKKMMNSWSMSYQATVEPYEWTAEIERDKLEDGEFTELYTYVRGGGIAAAKWKDDLMFERLLAGTSATVPCIDGKAFFATDHPINPKDPGSSTFANLITGSALTDTNFATRYWAFSVKYGWDGRVLGDCMADTIMVPPQLADKAYKITKQSIHAHPSLGASETNIYANLVDVIVCPELAGEDDVWYLAKLKGAVKPMVFAQRKDPTFVAKFDPKDDKVFYEGKFTYGCEARGSMWWGLPHFMERNEA